MRSDVESDEFTTVSYEAVPPRKRDFWRVLLGRWKPEVRRVERLTVKGFDRLLRQTWTPERVEAQMLAPNPLLGYLRTDDARDG